MGIGYNRCIDVVRIMQIRECKLCFVLKFEVKDGKTMASVIRINMVTSNKSQSGLIITFKIT